MRPTYTTSHAIGDDIHRYYLQRGWTEGDLSRLTWCMLNPSTADGTTDDPTIRRIVRFSQREGYAGIWVINLFALRTTTPAALHRHPDPVGPRNRQIITSTLAASTALVVAWGAAVETHPAAAAERDHLFRQAARHQVPVYALGTTKAGHPRHPLYLRADTPLEMNR